MKNIFSTFLIIILSLNISKHVSAANDDDIYKKIDLFSEVLDKINKEYVEDINQSEVMDAAINGVLQWMISNLLQRGKYLFVSNKRRS